MEFLKRIFGGRSSPTGGVSGDPDGMYFFIQPRGCDEVVRVRINRMNDLSLSDDGASLWVHKIVRGVKCRQVAELDLYFDVKNRQRLINSVVKDGTLVDQSVYETWIASQAAP